jgi:Zn-dependent protease/CBS domain-containing protein
MNDALPLGRLAGIPVRLHASWFLVAALVIWSLAAAYFPETAEGYSSGAYWIAAIVAAGLFFGSLLAHEFAHALVATQRGMRVASITLYLFGGVAAIETESETAADEFWMTVVGPLTSLGLGGVFGVIWLAAGDGSPLVAAMLGYLAFINVALGLFNLIPGFPLDGGRLLRALVWWKTKSEEKATRVAAGAGVLFGYLLIVIGIARAFTGSPINGVWFVFLGWYLQSMADQYRRHAGVQRLFSGLRAVDLANPEPLYVRPDDRLDRVAEDVILAHGIRTVPVLAPEPPPEQVPGPQGDHFLGLLTLANLSAVPRAEWETTTAEQAMIPAEKLYTVRPADPVEDAVRVMAQHDVNQLVVLEDGRFVGLLSRGTVIRHLEVRSKLADADG